jgi:uncharacterized membrane protein
MTEHNVITVTFADRANAFQALSELKGASFEGRVDVQAAGVVVRDENGRLDIAEGLDNEGGNRTWGGSLIGLLVGVIGGPIGMLFGWTTGLLIGGAFDIRRADRSETVLGEISRSIPVGGTALVAEVTEVAREVIDGEMAKLGGTVFRRDADLVLDELETAEEAYEAAQKEADRAAKEQRKAERKQSADERKAKLKEKLGIS